MKYVLDILDNKKEFAEEFFKSISFIKKARAIEANEITSQRLLNSIELYEKGLVKPNPVTLKELKALTNA